MKPQTIVLALALSAAGSAQAGIVSAFSENFEGTLAAWTDRNPSNPEAAIVIDPLRAGNHVLSFNRLGSAGSIYTTDLITSSGNFTVSFEYLGRLGQGGAPNDLGGFFGISQGLPGTHYWVAGTGSYPAPIDLIDDGTWHSYTLTFASPVGSLVHLMYEDYAGSGGVAGDVYFDNIRFNDQNVPPAPFQAVPEPLSTALFGVGLAALGFSRRRKA
ncbi:MAG: PEP-CTERM sorting domain-containing protein [Betaproteobacteria bacterium]|nr:PEP-CTERM sorting domain-containing protein [Betaproteobacteria bacterium]